MDLQSDVDPLDSHRLLEHQARNEIRRLSNDLFNRLHSISEDARFVEDIQALYPHFPVVENLRCGSWYVKPAINRASAYFKSADGHYNAWTFNLRRPNIQILPLIAKHHGLILVDSTRSGKRMPDALSKTVPIWCAVVNRAVRQRSKSKPVAWDTRLYTPSETVSKQEHWQIEERIEDWATALSASSYELPQLTKPIRPIWITPATKHFPDLNENTEFFPIICLSASRIVLDGLERRESGYTYVQGAGDDHESWCLGLTPAIFWTFRDDILNTPQDEMDDFVRSLVQQHAGHTRDQGKKDPTRIQRANGAIALSSNIDVPLESLRAENTDNQNDYCYLVINSTIAELEDEPRIDYFFTRINVDKKVGEGSLATHLPDALQFAKDCLLAGRSVCISCETGTDLSAVVALAVLQSFFDNDGRLAVEASSPAPQADKQSLRNRLQWIIASRPEANPSRTALKRLNEFFMSPPR